MTTIFSKIIAGEIPGSFVWKDSLCVAFADINPVQEGHILIVPREEVENYWEASPELFAHLAQVSQLIGQAQRKAFNKQRACQIIAGFDVPHLHIHSIPCNQMSDFNPKLAKPCPSIEIELACAAIRKELKNLGPVAASGAQAAEN